ncbi:putative transcription factor Nin-like family [Helianthus annuus]|nr:putative transcription factor Nin-like family [Helianthus annuus]
MNRELSGFLEAFPNHLHYIPPESDGPWAFWSQHENNSSSADLMITGIHQKIISAFSKFVLYPGFLAQFWAPTTVGGRWVLSTSTDQPFAVSHLFKEFAMYRLHSAKYKYNIDVNKLDTEPDHMIIRGGPATAFLTRLPYIYQLEWIPTEDCYNRLNSSIMLPICFPSQSRSSCIGVLEFTLDLWSYDLGFLVLDMIKALKKADVNVCNAQKLIPYKTINGLKPAKDEIEEALKVVCVSHKLALAHVWIAYEDINDVLFSSSLEDTRIKRLLALKLTGYLYAVTETASDDFDKYYNLCDVIPQGTFPTGRLALKTLQDYESRYISTLRSDRLVDWKEDNPQSSAFAICLRSNDTGDLDYAFEFIWIERSYTTILLEALLLTLKRYLPSFKFASGEELGDELNVINVETSIDSEETNETEKFKVFQGKRSSPPLKVVEGQKSMAVDYIAPSEVKCKTTEIVLPREDIEKQFGKTMKEAAKNLTVSESTLKRKLKKLGIREWLGPNFVKKSKANDSSIIQFNLNEEDNEAIQEPSTVNINKNTITIKAEYANDMIKFRLPNLQATFVTIQKEISMKFKLNLGTYKLKYRDEVGDWILLTSDEDMSYCIESSRKLDSNEVRLLVLPSIQPILY